MNWYAAWVLIMFSVISYITPTIVALCREVPNRGSVIVVNILLGWSIVGWAIALAMAVRSKPGVAS